jgi:hypothetical protein
LTEAFQRHSDVVEIARRNGDFRRNYGILIGAFLYLRSLNATRSRPFYWITVIGGLISGALPWLVKLGWG